MDLRWSVLKLVFSAWFDKNIRPLFTNSKKGLKEAVGAVTAAGAIGVALYYGTEVFAWVRELLPF